MLGLETIYEGCTLVHYGRPRLFSRLPTRTSRCCSATTSTRRASFASRSSATWTRSGDLAELISLCAHLQAERAAGDALVWAATSAHLGLGALDEAWSALRAHGDLGAIEAAARDAVGEDELERSLAAHGRLLG